MKAKELRNKSLVELRDLAEELKKKLNQLLLEKTLKKLKKTHLLRLMKKDYARVLTVIREKQLKNN